MRALVKVTKGNRFFTILIPDLSSQLFVVAFALLKRDIEHLRLCYTCVVVFFMFHFPRSMMAIWNFSISKEVVAPLLFYEKNRLKDNVCPKSSVGTKKCNHHRKCVERILYLSILIFKKKNFSLSFFLQEKSV